MLEAGTDDADVVKRFVPMRTWQRATDVADWSVVHANPST